MNKTMIKQNNHLTFGMTQDEIAEQEMEMYIDEAMERAEEIEHIYWETKGENWDGSYDE